MVLGIEISAQSILLRKRLEEKVDKDVSLAKVKKLKNELVDLGYFLQATLNANVSLGSQLKNSTYAHFRCEVEKKGLGKKVSQMSAGEGRLWKNFYTGYLVSIEDILEKDGVETFSVSKVSISSKLFLFKLQVFINIVKVGSV
ncbi:hypothetical protein VNO80_18824 [Phaseolus coccineus]|uniref:Uncharacterized protein n=1 Tax=Phaseolus coccineus TaxID=3886 RepID=A0AAN9ML31_PHACN